MTHDSPASLNIPQLQELLADCSIEAYDTVGSTQDRAHELAQAEGRPPRPVLIVAEEQTAGRGRGANRWWTGRGSLAFSLLVDPECWSLSRDVRPVRSLAVGVAVVEVIAPLVPNARVGLRWPNDVYIEGHKLGGILIDVTARNLTIIGVGLNVNNTLAAAPPEVRARATSLIEIRSSLVDRTALLGELIGHIKGCLRDCEDRPAELGARIDAVCLQRGEQLTVKAGENVVRGICLGIAEDGGLMLDTLDGPRRIYSGSQQ